MDTTNATDDVTDVIAAIEMHRQELEKEGGLDASRNFSLRKLQEVLHREQEALQLRGPGAGHPANIQAVTKEIIRVKALGAGASRRATLTRPQPRQSQKSWQDAQRTPGKSRSRRTMGRRTGR